MVICINRFHQLQNGSYIKDDTLVFCDPIIALPGVASTSKLVGTVMHKGRTLTSGHYTAMVKANNMWYSCNDIDVHMMQNVERHLHSREVYLLFYVQENLDWNSLIHQGHRQYTTMGAAYWVSWVIGTETLYPVGYSWWPCCSILGFHCDIYISHLVLVLRWRMSLDFDVLLAVSDSDCQDLQKKTPVRAFPFRTEFVWRFCRVIYPSLL